MDDVLVQGKIRRFLLSDLAEVVDLHQKAFPGFFMTLLGPRFLKKYYELVYSYPQHVFLVKTGDRGLEGFVSGCINPGRFYSFMRTHRARLLTVVFSVIFFRPWLLYRLAASYRYAGNVSRVEDDEICELSSIAVHPEFSGCGVGNGLIEAFSLIVKEKVSNIILTTDADGNEAVNAFYQRRGFELTGKENRSKGRVLNVYQLKVSNRS